MKVHPCQQRQMKNSDLLYGDYRNLIFGSYLINQVLFNKSFFDCIYMHVIQGIRFAGVLANSTNVLFIAFYFDNETSDHAYDSI